MEADKSAQPDRVFWLLVVAAALLVVILLGFVVVRSVSSIASLSNNMITATVAKSGQAFDLDHCMATRNGGDATISFGGFNFSNIAVKGYTVRVEALDVRGNEIKSYVVRSDGGIATGFGNVTNRDMESVTLPLPKQTDSLRCSIARAALADGTSWVRR
ncbi:MAG TPA: hypothetical protein VJP85_11035 [Candidatus Baltobacteraceae bacterium]|nr:hypothetical protein [Candidatus Baltobacteraceae bacterium]